MRAEERITPFLKLIRENKDSDVHKLIMAQVGEEKFENTIKKIETVWRKNPDWRFTQLLVNTNIIPNVPGLWYYKEDSDHFPNNKADLYFWGTYGKNGDEPYNKIAIKDMSTSHLIACLKTQKQMSEDYKSVMVDELNKRNIM